MEDSGIQLFSKLSNENIEECYFVIADNRLVNHSQKRVLSLDSPNPLIRRIKHTANWCWQKQSSHHYDQILFDCTDNSADIFCRHFSFRFKQEQLVLLIGPRLPYQDAILNGQFEATLFDSVSDAMLLTVADPFDEPGPKIVYCNQTFLEMTGYEKSEVLGRSPRFLQGSKTTDKSRKAIREGLANWSKVKQLITNYRKDGSTFDVELNIAPIADETGWYSHWISAQRDMSAHRDILAYIRQSTFILSAANIACWYFDFSNDDLYWDEKMYAFHGISKTELSGQIVNWLEWIHPDDHEKFNMSLIRAITGEDELSVEYRLLSANEQNRWFRLKAEIMEHEFTQSVTLSGVCFDITSEKESQFEMEKHRIQAEQSAKLASLGELAAGVGHEVNNPLSVITTSVDLLEALLNKPDALTQKLPQSIDRMRDASHRISKIVSGLKNISTVARDPSGLGSLNLYNDIKQTLSMLEELYAKDEISLRVIADEQTKASFVQAEHSGLQQVLVNLISNARDAVESSPLKNIVVKLESSATTCSIIVEDSGEGIQPAMQDRIFEPFATTKPVGKGTGLGLSISKSIIESFGGKLTFERHQDKTIFKCELLRRFDKSEITNAAPTPTHQVKALIVEDDQLVAECVIELLATLTCNAEHAENGAQALNMVMSNDYDLIITDLKMPILGGVEFLKTLNKKGLAKNALKYVITGDIIEQHNDMYHQLKTYADGILQKPVRQIDLAQILNHQKTQSHLHRH